MRDDGTPLQNGTDHIQFDPRIAKYRAIVERVIGAMKRWSFLGTGRLLYGELQKPEQVIHAIAALTNLRLKDRDGPW